MKLTDNKEAQRECRELLSEWGRWGHPEDDPVPYAAMSLWELVEAGKAFDSPAPFTAPIDENRAFSTDQAICAMGQEWPEFKRTLQLHYYGERIRGEWKRFKQPWYKLRPAEQAFWDELTA